MDRRISEREHRAPGEADQRRLLVVAMEANQLVEVPNVASRRALEKTGYRQCGLMRRHVFVGGQWLDVWLGEILREDWDRAREAACTAR